MYHFSNFNESKDLKKRRSYYYYTDLLKFKSLCFSEKQ